MTTRRSDYGKIVLHGMGAGVGASVGASASVGISLQAGKSVLSNLIRQVLPFVERKSTIPILANVLVAVDADRMCVTGTDLDNSLTVWAECKVKQTGAVTIPARKLADTLAKLKSLDASEISLESNAENWVTLSCGPIKVKLPGMAASSYPQLEKFPEAGVYGELAAGSVVVLIRRTKHAMAQEESRYTLNGGLLETGPKQASMTATNGHVLVRAELTGEACSGGAVAGSKVLVNRTALTLLEELTGKMAPGKSVQLAKSASNLFFRGEGWTMVSRAMTGQFPNWQAVMPKDGAGSDYNKDVIVGVQALEQALKRVAGFADERSQKVRFTLVPGKGLELQARSMENGEATELVPGDCDTPNASPMVMGFSSEYVLNVLATMKGDKLARVALKLRDNQSAGLWISLNEPVGWSMRTVVMPMGI